jgi:hypothetical protein
VRDKAADPELRAWPTGLVWTAVGFRPAGKPVKITLVTADTGRQRGATYP